MSNLSPPARARVIRFSCPDPMLSRRRYQRSGAPPGWAARPWEVAVVKKGQLEVSKADSPKQGEPRDPNGPKPKRTAGSQSQRRARGQSEGSGSKG